MESEYSVRIFKEFTQELPGRNRAFDVGAGIGRVTKTILKHAFDDIDILDQSPIQIAEAKKYVPFVKK